MSSYGYFETDLLINFFIPPRQAEKFTWEDFVLTIKQDTGSTKKGSCLVRMKLFDLVIYEDFIALTGSQQSKTEFNSCQPGSCNHHLSLIILRPDKL